MPVAEAPVQGLRARALCWALAEEAAGLTSEEAEPRPSTRQASRARALQEGAKQGQATEGQGMRGRNRRNCACYLDAPSEHTREEGGWDSQTCVWGPFYGARAQSRPQGSGEGDALPHAPMAQSGGWRGSPRRNGGRI